MNFLGALRLIHEDELELMLTWRNAPAVRRNMYTHHEITLVEHLAWWQQVRERSDCRYLMYVQDGVPAGIVYITQLNGQDSSAFWGFYSSPNAPRGIGSCMEFLTLEHVFEDLRLHKLSCEVLAFNQPVLRLHEKFGFRVEGIFREQHALDGEFHDVHRLALLRREWLAGRDELLQRLSQRAGRAGA